MTTHTTTVASPNGSRPPRHRPRAWGVFVRLELMGPIHALGGLSELLGQEAEGKRPDEYLDDVRKLQQAAGRLLDLAGGLLELGGGATSTDLEESLRLARHDLGNRLNQLCGMVQLLQIAEEALFGAFLPDLEKMLDLCRDCEVKLLRQGVRGVSEQPARVGSLSDAEIELVVEEIAVERRRPAVEVPAGQVLIADDDPVNREVLRRLLTHQGHKVAEAVDGHEAVRMLEQGTFDVLLLDILMPRQNGFQVLQRLRAEERLGRTSVIVISALEEVHGLVRCLEAGAEDYLTKPVDKVLLQARINSCLQKRRQRERELEQFFPPEVVARLVDRPEMLRTGRTADVSILFCDIRGFSRISERLRHTPEVMVQWISAVMGTLDECVLRHQGVLIDFIGDELLAMWGAPQEQPDHARRACRAALEMQACVSRLSDDWKAVIGEETAVGIGINSGPVSVGNTGTKRRFKYGPIGNTVNLASRVQGLTKHLHSPLLVTGATRRQLDTAFLTRRVVKARVMNIEEPVDLCEVERADDWGRRHFFAESEMALDALENRNFAQAARLAGQLLLAQNGDGPLLMTLARAAEALVRSGTGFDPVWTPPGK